MSAIGDGLEEGRLGSHGLLLAPRAHGSGVDAAGQIVQVPPGGGSEDLLQASHVGGSQGAHVVDPPALQNLCALVSHAPQRTHRQDVEEVPGGVGGHEEQSIGLGMGGGELGDELGGGNTNGGGHTDAPADLGADPLGDLDR